MAATPKGGVFVFIGKQTGMSYNKDIYRSDVAAAKINWDGDGTGAGPASDDFWTAPEPLELIDVSLITGTADTTKLSLVINSLNTGHTIDYVSHVGTSNARPVLRIPIGKGSKIQAIQRA